MHIFGTSSVPVNNGVHPVPVNNDVHPMPESESCMLHWKIRFAYVLISCQLVGAMSAMLVMLPGWNLVLNLC